ncbi:hypothetical protein INR49_027285 [Caranx melampygus]|nr:hypothetical protein INR49_027285 [Caranx melampygus]
MLPRGLPCPLPYHRADQGSVLAVGLSVGFLLLLLLLGLMVYCLWRKRNHQRQYQELLSITPSVPVPACSAPVILVSQCSWATPSEIPFTLPPRFTAQKHGDVETEDKEEVGMRMKTRRDILAHRGSLSVQSWFPVGTVLAGLYSVPPLNEVVAPPPGMATRLCFSVEYRHGSEQLMVSLLRLGNLPPRFHGNVTLVELRLLPDDRRPRQAKARGTGPDPEFNDCLIFQCSELGDVQVSLCYSPTLQRLSVVVVRARGLQLLTATGVCVQVSLQIHTQVVKIKRSCVVRGESDPYFDHRTTFKLRSQHLDEACLRFELQQPNDVHSVPPAQLGVLVLGPFMYARGPQLQHWMDMVNTPQEPVKHFIVSSRWRLPPSRQSEQPNFEPASVEQEQEINENTLLEGHTVVLVPYNAEHVPRYHEWMKSPELQQLTASEPLTLEQEYDMQRSWREDNDKCTFIILDKQQWVEPGVEEEQCMVGDVNIFLTDPTDLSIAELEIMIAEPSYRGRGIGKEVTRMMMCYGVTKLGVKKFQAKIGLDNEVSISMFKKLGFQEVTVCQVFKEVTLEMTVDESVQMKLQDETRFMKEKDYTQTCSHRQEEVSQ